ncbi:dihydrolipoamide acetyltransferase family protein [Streptomyces sp. NPDC056149]|uniref:dihydrolipoamide acetyltransferase family protein n=1 Tax=Streptomyces sp. NPDC056149 TaxID=3345728 RepID=UPI0035D674D0
MTAGTAGAANAQRIREFKMPDVGEGLTEAEILKWYVRPGDTVTDGQVVCEVETAKAAVELPIPYDGVVHAVNFDEGTTVDVGTVIIAVDTDPGAGPVQGQPGAGEAPADAAEEDAEPQGRQAVLVGYGAAPSSTKRRARKPQPGAGPQPATRVPHASVGAPSEPVTAGLQAELNGRGAPAPAATAVAVAAPPAVPAAAVPATGRPLAKPPVRKLAKDLGIDLAMVVPTGPGGVITRDDVHAAVAPVEAAPAVAPAVPAVGVPAAAAAVGAFDAARERRVPVKGVRKATAQAMVASAFTAPHVTEFITVDVTRTMKLVQELKQDPDMAGLRVNPLLLVAKAFLVALKRHPEANAAWDEANQEIVYKDYINLGIAAATPRGLIVPNIKDAGTKALPQLAAELGELVATAREGKTTPAAMSGGTVTITNVGVFGVDTGTPILNPGESAILAFGAIKLQPWVHKGRVKARQVTTLALSFDHRLIDGELGSKLLADIAAVLERPKRLITWG